MGWSLLQMASTIGGTERSLQGGESYNIPLLHWVISWAICLAYPLSIKKNNKKKKNTHEKTLFVNIAKVIFKPNWMNKTGREWTMSYNEMDLVDKYGTLPCRFWRSDK